MNNNNLKKHTLGPIINYKKYNERYLKYKDYKNRKFKLYNLINYIEKLKIFKSFSNLAIPYFEKQKKEFIKECNFKKNLCFKNYRLADKYMNKIDKIIDNKYFNFNDEISKFLHNSYCYTISFFKLNLKDKNLLRKKKRLAYERVAHINFMKKINNF